ncbi:phosphatidylinositol-trisphosphate 3-phosphatase and dual-specificity protein phosphatase pten-like [Stylonychia lemnae]|uniref:phosphatidylinositol-3,4,5-trisphosphate 3-phosphatase n=1 Tax=Stylonychia lemnae TaxID=5949 RepID=A0A078B0V7_STYLE|nr:phosphatidylinositol-trisphosphate 3-phosphatase and dual-specificity protein phosphatase pten-like [Stylonychia lemnae]|eukprot:CDW87941.1 phosphatidylinositol-trisphosphate 3-phosphatase and dual-specificity protein phosphatase pten-like [Stylonychia lemnae]
MMKVNNMVNQDVDNAFDDPQNRQQKIVHNINLEQFEHFKLQKLKDKIQIDPIAYQNKIYVTFQLSDEQSNQLNLLIFITEKVELQSLDDFSDEYYNTLLKQKKIIRKKQQNSKSACIQTLVSQNRMRYQDQEFNLDLAYITKRVMAMGFPAQGIRQIYRNPLNKVLGFFKKFHQNKVKVYNLCDDDFIDTNILSFNNGEVQVAYFPMMDHNPCRIQQIFHMLLDMLLYMIQDPENMVAVHCKAGKGRTGVAISAYLIFMEACTDGYDAVDFFNSRRTKDGKGLGVASQKRYLHYFDRFLKQNFKSPYKQLIVPYLQNPEAFNHLFLPKTRIKLMTICIGPFKLNPSSMNIKISLRSFENPDLFKKSQKNKIRKSYSQNNVYNKQADSFFILLVIHEDISFAEDLCIKIKSTNLTSSQKLTFHYWLNARFVSDGVGKVQISTFMNKDQIIFGNFMIPMNMG